jgi:hypothetical protein
MKLDRERMELAKTQNLQAIAERLRRPPETILRVAIRLGIEIKGQKNSK